MNEFITWFHMGGYASYVWSAYILTFLFVGGSLIHAVVSHKRILKDLHVLQSNQNMK